MRLTFQIANWNVYIIVDFRRLSNNNIKRQEFIKTIECVAGLQCKRSHVQILQTTIFFTKFQCPHVRARNPIGSTPAHKALRLRSPQVFNRKSSWVCYDHFISLFLYPWAPKIRGLKYEMAIFRLGSKHYFLSYILVNFYYTLCNFRI